MYFSTQRTLHRGRSTYRAVTTAEALQTGLGGGKVLLGDNLLHHIDDNIPQFGVLVLEQDDGTRGLRVERRRHVLHRLLHDIDHLCVGDRRRGRERVDGAATLDGLEECVGHGGGGGCGCGEEATEGGRDGRPERDEYDE